jgi:hypothetical protein
MKKIQFGMVIAYGFLAVVLVILLTWALYVFVPQAEAFTNQIIEFQGDRQESKNLLDTTLNYQRPYMTWENKQGDFEGGMDQTYLNKFEGGIETNKNALNMAMREFPFDWSQSGPSSSLFQEQNAILLDKENLLRNATSIKTPPGLMTQTDLNAARLLPVSEGFSDIGPEDAVLKSYSPQDTTTVGKYSEDDALDFINKYYDAQGLVPEVVKTGDNQYEVVGTQEKNPKIVYEDEVNRADTDTWSPMDQEYMVSAQYKTDRKSGLDPTQAQQMKTNMNKDTKESQLNRIFGPGLQFQQWG